MNFASLLRLKGKRSIDFGYVQILACETGYEDFQNGITMGYDTKGEKDK